jgi:dTDP-4-amino-4,6-dideoxygalactose transaminase
MTELQGAVGIAQLKRLHWLCGRRTELGSALTEGLKDLPQLDTMEVAPDSRCTYWFYMFRLVDGKLNCTRDEFGAALDAEGIKNRLGYIPSVIYMQPMFQNKQAYLDSQFPFDLTGVDYQQGDCPVAEEVLKTAIQVPINEFYTDQDIMETIKAIRKVTLFYSK